MLLNLAVQQGIYVDRFPSYGTNVQVSVDYLNGHQCHEGPSGQTVLGNLLQVLWDPPQLGSHI